MYTCLLYAEDCIDEYVTFLIVIAATVKFPCIPAVWNVHVLLPYGTNNICMHTYYIITLYIIQPKYMAGEKYETWSRTCGQDCISSSWIVASAQEHR